MGPRACAAVVLAAALALAPAVPAAASADVPVSWTVAPADAGGADGRSWIERGAEAGETFTEHLALRNVGAEPATFLLSAADAYFTESGRFSMLQTGEVSVGAGTWIDLPEEVAVAPGETAILPFTVNVPTDAEPGDHAAGVAASVLRGGTTADGTRVGVESRVGFRVVTRVEGELAPALAVDDLTAAYAGTWDLFSPGTLTVAYTARNAGNTALDVDERIGGVETARGELLPGEERMITAEPVRRWPLGPVTVEVALTADAVDGVTVPSATGSVVVWAVPWAHLLTLVALALLATALLVGRRRGRARVARLIDEARAAGRREAEA